MKKEIVLLAAAIAVNAYAAEERDPAKIVKKYSETVACQISDKTIQPLQYKAVVVNPGMADLDGMGAQTVVFWQGDFGCSGGNGTVVPNFTVVEQSGFTSVPPIVKTDYTFPDLNLVRVTGFTGKNGLLMIKGVTYGDKDQQGWPKKAVSYTLKLVENAFVKQ